MHIGLKCIFARPHDCPIYITITCPCHPPPRSGSGPRGPGPLPRAAKAKFTGLTQTLGQLQQPLIGILSQTAGSTDKFWVNPVNSRLPPFSTVNRVLVTFCNSKIVVDEKL
jgi:hypothetical protein